MTDNKIEKKYESPFEVYVDNLPAYTAGHPEGEWIRLPEKEEQLKEIINRMSRNGKEEIMISDYNVRENCAWMNDMIGEWDNVYELNVIAQLIGSETHPAVGAYIYSAGNLSLSELANLIVQESEIPFYPYEFEGSDNAEIMSRLSDEEKMGYTRIEADSEIKTALEKMTIDDTMLINYINVEAIGRDMSLNGNVCLYEDGFLNERAEGLNLALYTMDEIRAELRQLETREELQEKVDEKAHEAKEIQNTVQSAPVSKPVKQPVPKAPSL